KHDTHSLHDDLTIYKNVSIEYEVKGMPNSKGLGYVDYVLFGDNGKPLALIEAKRTSVDVNQGKQQAKLYADCLENMYDQRPIILDRKSTRLNSSHVS